MLPVNIYRQMHKEINVTMELYEGQSPEQSTENVEERASETRYVRGHQLQRHLNQSWINKHLSTTTRYYSSIHNTKTITIYILKVT
jgi:hypothetical protein